MRRRTAHVEILDRRAELRVSRHRAQEEKLFQRKLTLKNVSFGKTPLALQIERRHNLLVQDDVLDVGRVFRNGVDDVVAECFFLIVPVQPGTQLVDRKSTRLNSSHSS